MLLATACVGLFTVLDLAITWTNYASLITLSGNYAAAANDAQSTAYLGLVTGTLGIVAVVGPLFVSALSITIIIASILTTVWVLFVGYGLYRLGQQ